MATSLGLGVLVSGRGTNLQSIIDAIERGKLKAAIKVVISNVKDASALGRAQRHNIPTLFVDPKGFKSKEDYDQELLRLLKERGVELVILAGFMRIMTPLFVRSFPQAILNIHPALLPSFPGLKVQAAAMKHAVKFSGATVHIVDEGVDTGPIVIQAVVPILDSDTEESLAERILQQEHKIYPQAIQWFAEGRVRVDGRKVTIIGGKEPAHPILFNPPLEIE